MIGRRNTSFNIRHHAFCSRAQHHRRRRSRYCKQQQQGCSEKRSRRDRLLMTSCKTKLWLWIVWRPVSGRRLCSRASDCLPRTELRWDQYRLHACTRTIHKQNTCRRNVMQTTITYCVMVWWCHTEFCIVHCFTLTRITSLKLRRQQQRGQSLSPAG